HELVDEAVAGKIKNPCIWIAFHHLLTDGLQKVRFAEPHSTVDEQWIVLRSGLFGRSNTGGVRQPVAGAGNVALKHVVRVERQGLVSFVEDTTSAKRIAVKTDHN